MFFQRFVEDETREDIFIANRWAGAKSQIESIISEWAACKIEGGIGISQQAKSRVPFSLLDGRTAGCWIRGGIQISPSQATRG